MHERTLARMAEGEHALISEIHVPDPERVRLFGLGVLPGVNITVLRNGRRALIVEAARTCLVLARPLAESILMEEA